MMPPFAVATRACAVRLHTRYIQGCLFFMSLHSASMVGARALGPQNTSATHSGGGLVFDRASHRMHATRPEDLTSRTAVDVAHRIISKGFIAEDVLLASRPGFEKRVSHVRGDPALLTSHVILSRPILGISNDDLRLAARVALVLIEQLQQFFVFRDRSRRRLSGGDHALLIINHPMVFVTWTRVAATLAH